MDEIKEHHQHRRERARDDGEGQIRKVVSIVLTELGRMLQYSYFLRFSLGLWFFPALLVALNQTPLRMLTSGIVTPEETAQYVCVAFLLVGGGFVALISARVVLINGRERFRAEPPYLLHGLLTYEGSHYAKLMETVVLLLSQVWNFVVFWYFIANGKHEFVHTGSRFGILEGLVYGFLLAVIVWWVINAIFYATYEIRKEAAEAAGKEEEHPAEDAHQHALNETVRLGSNAARTILFPRWCFLLAPVGAPILKQADTLEGYTTPLRMLGTHRSLRPAIEWGKQVVGYHGYSKTVSSRLFEAHAFSIAALGASFVLYALIGAATAPVPMVGLTVGLFAVMLALVAVLCVVLARLRRFDGLASSKTPLWSVSLILLLLIFLGSSGALYYFGDPERFPSFGLLILLAIAANWVLSGLAFWADRYRVPVLLAIVVAMAVPRYFGWVGQGEEHYISTAAALPNDQLQSPDAIFEAFSQRNPGQPAIIVTATGGGLHASAWTVAVLNHLEEAFHVDGAPKESFHDHLLLASTVSGGSIGLMSYLYQLQLMKSQAAKQAEPAYNPDQALHAADCSSLEAVTWGLLYYDLPKAFVPMLPYFIAPSSGLPESVGDGQGATSDLDKAPLFKDRTWALRKGFARNLRNQYCVDGNSNLSQDLSEQPAFEEAEKALTLGHLLGAGQDPFTPAISMNTTTVEGGARFLLANYELPTLPGQPHQEKLGGNESYPAQSFLDVYRDENNARQSIDLPLATAAQMSATFPYVSSAARIPLSFTKSQYHFIDGGYYDNDGTASAIEFLRSMLEARENQRHQDKVNCDNEKDPKKKSACEKELAKPLVPVRIVLAEIRNSGDPDNDIPVPSKDPWNIGDQLLGPLLGLWNGGHESVTQRNRVALDLLQQAYPTDKLQLQRVVLADNCSGKDENCQNYDKDKTDPLNWSLTPAQRAEICESSRSIKDDYHAVLQWFRAGDGEWNGGILTKTDAPTIAPCARTR